MTDKTRDKDVGEKTEESDSQQQSRIKNLLLPSLIAFRTRLCSWRTTHFERVAGTVKPKEAAAIHATVLSILVGVFSAYSIYAYGEIRTKQQDAISKAEEINRIQFIRSEYTPEGNDVVMAAGPKDIERLKANLRELIMLTSQERGGLKIGEVTIPEDPAERAERILGIMNVVSHRYPFPKDIEGSYQPSGKLSLISHSFFGPEPIVFTDIETLRQWLKDLGEVVRNLTLMTHAMPLFFPRMMNPYLEALTQREKENIEKAKEDPRLRGMGERDPFLIVKDFITGMSRVTEIYHSTLTALNRADKWQAGLISKPASLIILLSGLTIFMIGVVFPLVSIRLNAFFYIHLPLLYYTVVYIMIVIKIMHM